MKKQIKINFLHMPPGFRPHPKAILHWCPELDQYYDFLISDNPDYVFYSVFDGKNPRVDKDNIYHFTMPVLNGNCVRIFYSGENCRADMDQCDWAFTFDYDEELQNDRHYRYPNYIRLGAGSNFLKDRSYDVEKIMAKKSRFCNFIYRHETPQRVRFFNKLSKYKKVDAPGTCMQNMAALSFTNNVNQEKIDFISSYKFTIAFENISVPGYTTEKLYHAMRGNSVAIYWGNPLVHRDFNKASFIHCHDFTNEDEVIQKVIELDQNDELYQEYLKEPWYNNNVPSSHADRDKLLVQFMRIFGE